MDVGERLKWARFGKNCLPHNFPNFAGRAIGQLAKQDFSGDFLYRKFSNFVPMLTRANDIQTALNGNQVALFPSGSD